MFLGSWKFCKMLKVFVFSYFEMTVWLFINEHIAWTQWFGRRINYITDLFSLAFRDAFISLKGTVNREKGKTKTNRSIHRFTPQMVAVARVGLGQSWESGDFSRSSIGTEALEMSSVDFSSAWAGNWIVSRTARAWTPCGVPLLQNIG